MKILLTCHRNPFINVGGSETVIREMREGLEKAGHEVHVWFLDLGNGSVFRTDKYYLKRLQDPTLDAVVLFGQNVWCTDGIWRHVKSIPAKTVYFPVGFLRMHRPSPLRGRPIDFAYHHIVQKRLLETADVVAVMTRAEGWDVIKLAKPKSLVLIPPGINCNRYPQDENNRNTTQTPIILNIGGNYGNKRLYLLIQAMRHLRDHQLVLIGPGTEKIDFHNVRGLGVVEESDKLTMLSRANLVAQTSDFEGFGLSLLEGLASGINFASTPVGIAPELNRNHNIGRLIPHTDPVNLSREILIALEDDTTHSYCRNIANTYDWKVVIPKLEKVLR